MSRRVQHTGVVVVVTCNGCKQTISLPEPASLNDAAVDRSLDARHWQYNGREDFCTECVEKLGGEHGQTQPA